MTKNDYIEKITQNLEHLTKDELKDVSILTAAQFGVRLKVAEKEYWEKEIADLKSQLQQQALPVVPECVDIWIKKCQELNWLITDALAPEAWSSDFAKDTENWLKESKENFNLLAVAFITGEYEVEKPQQKRYEVKLLSGESMYFNPIGNPKNIKDYRFSFGNHAGWKTKFTKSELAEIKDGMFLKRIPGGMPLDDLGKDNSYYVWLDDCNYWKNPLIELVPVEDGE